MYQGLLLFQNFLSSNQHLTAERIIAHSY